MECVHCGNLIYEKRAQAGYITCKACGSKEASKEQKRKQKCVAPAYNKGGYQYVTSKKMAKDVGK